MASTSKLGLTVYNEADKSTVLWSAYWRAMAKNDANSNMTKIDAEFAKLAQKNTFTIAADATWADLSGVANFTKSTTVTLSNVDMDGSTIMAMFDDANASSGVILYSAVQSGSDVVLTFYATEAKTVAITGVILYVY